MTTIYEKEENVTTNETYYKVKYKQKLYETKFGLSSISIEYDICKHFDKDLQLFCFVIFEKEAVFIFKEIKIK
jgi:hypothetical protein